MRSALPEPVDIILLSYNRLDYLERMVDALERNTVYPHRITIVDNVSDGPTRQWLRDNSERFHQVVFNRRNEHLAAHEHGIRATTSPLFVVSDADLLPYAPTAEGCWLTRLVGLAERHPGFGLIACRIDSESIRTEGFADAELVDGELIEAPTGVWLNLMRREALRVPYMSDGITCYALGRAGYRVGIASDVFATHLGDDDAALHPEYLARKQAATRLGTVYPEYPELLAIPRPPTLEELAWATPVLAALEANGIAPEDAVELSRRPWPPVAAVEPAIESAVATTGPAAATWRYAGEPPLHAGGALGVLLALPEHDPELLAHALARAGEWVVMLTPEPTPVLAPGWRIVDERPGAQQVLQRFAQLASGKRWRGTVGYSTLENRREWEAVFRAGSFGSAPLRLYVLRRDPALTLAETRWDTASAQPGDPPPWKPPLRRSNRAAALVTKAHRLLRAEWHLKRSRR